MNVGMRSQFSRFNAVGNSEQFPDPFLDVASLAMPDTMKNALHWCLPSGALVELEDFSLQPIEEMQVGQIVRRKDGLSGEIREVSRRPYRGKLVSLQYGGYSVDFRHRMTPEHKVWLYKDDAFQRVCAVEVNVGDVVATPVPSIQKCDPPRFGGWLLGMYLAEGCFIRDGWRRLGVRFTLGQDDEASGVLTKLRQEIADQTDLDVAAITTPSRPDVRLLTVHDPELPDWCHEHGGQKAQDKMISGKVLDYGVDFVMAMIAGLIDGDGWSSKQGLWLTTASKAMALQVVRLSNACGLLPSISLVDNDRGFGSDGAVAYQVGWGRVDSAKLRDWSIKALDVPAPAATARPRYSIRDGYVLRPVISTLLEDYEGEVHNFEVVGDHSYIADGVVTSNCEYIYSLFGTYRMAMERIVSYFLTEIEIGGDDVSDDEKDKYEDFLTNTIDAFTVLQNLLRDRMCYGNAFASLIVPFKRFLLCPTKGCGSFFPLREVHKNRGAFGFEWSNFEFRATCPKCKKRSVWTVVDKPDDEEKQIRVKRWSPHEIELLHDPYTDDVAYIWRIPEDYKKLVRDGNLFHLERASTQVLRAIKNNQLFRFNPEVIFHMKEPTLAGIRNRGWGIPRIISNFRQIYYVQVLRRFNEAIALDYVIPFRLITPQPRPGAGAGGLPTTDPLMMFNGGDFKGQVLTMIRKRRRDPAGWHVLPYPVQYQMLGGDAQALAPRDLLDQGMETLLNDAGTPVELYKGSLQLQTAPVALRLFESTWHHLVHDTNMFLQWLVTQVSQIMSWEVVEANLKRVTIADDMQKQMAALQLMMGQQLSGRSGLGALGYDWDSEQKRLAEEARKQQEIQARMQEEMEQAGFAQQIAKGQAGGPGAAGGAPPGGGDPNAAAAGGAPAAGGAAGGAPAGAMGGMGGSPVSQYVQSMGPNVPVTPNDLMSTADQLAQELLGLPEGVKDSELRKLKQYNEVLHSLVRAKMDAIRQQSRTQGGAQLMQQQFGQGGAAA